MKHKRNSQSLRPESQMMTAGFFAPWSQGSASCPIFATSNYVFETAEQGENAFALAYGLRTPKGTEKPELIYGRINEPNLQIAEERLTIFEKGAKDCAIFSSGLSALTTAFLEFLKPGDILLSSTPLYGGTDHFLTKILPSSGVKVIFCDASDTRQKITELINNEIKDGGKLAMIFIETPANPTNSLFNIRMFRELADRFSDTTKKVLLAVDNTYLGPI